MGKNVFSERDGELSTGPRKRMGIQRPEPASESGSDGLSECCGSEERKRSLRYEQGSAEPSDSRARDSAWAASPSKRNCSSNLCGRLDDGSARSGESDTSQIWEWGIRGG